MPHRLPTDVAVSLVDVLHEGEEILGAVTSLAGTLVLTDRRVLIVREGRAYRPQSGIRSWALSTKVGFTYGPPRGGMGRLVVGNGKDATSFFVKASDWAMVLGLVSTAHGIAHRAAAGERAGAWS